MVEAVDEDAKAITVSGTSAGITALEAEVVSYADQVSAYWKGFKGKEFAGLKVAITNTGTLHNIDASLYPSVWKGNSVTESGEMTFKKLMSSVAKAVARGLKEKAIVIMNPKTWTDIASQMAQMRTLDGSYRKTKAENGFESITLTSLNGELELVPLNICKEGDLFVVPPARCKRIGAQDLSYKDPTRGNGDVFFPHPTKTASCFRIYSHQALFLSHPARSVYVSGFENSGS